MMDNLWTITLSAFDTYFNVSLVLLLKNCRQTLPFIQNGDITKHASEGNDYINPVGNIKEIFNFMLGGGSREECVSGIEPGCREITENENCQDIIHTSLVGSASTVTITMTSAIVISLCLTMAVLRRCSMWKTVAGLCKNWAGCVSPPEEATVSTEIINKENQKEEAVKNVDCRNPTPETQTNFSCSLKNEIISETKPIVIPVSLSVCSPGEACQFFISSTLASNSQFLACTMDHLQTQLDWILSIANPDQFSPSSSNGPLSSVTASMVTPNLQRKGSIRRPRWRTPLALSLPFGADSSAGDEKAGVQMWQRVEDMTKKMKWTQVDVDDLDISAVKDNHLSAVLQFYQQTCHIPTKQWAAACLMVNYTLTLLQQELESLTFVTVPKTLHFVELCSFGSASGGTCISRADRFDVLMVVLASCSELHVYHSGVCAYVPPGKLVLGVKEAFSSASARPSSLLFRKDRVGDIFGMFMSQKEVVKATQKMLSAALEKLKLKNRPLLDRLPFTFQLDQYNILQLLLDTKLLNGVGLGLSKITIHFTPALRVSSPECDPLPALFAVPPWKSTVPSDCTDNQRSYIQSRIMRNQNQGITADLLWQLEGSELTKAFMTVAQRKISLAGYIGCQVMCQKILRALFSRSAKDNLLTMGEVHPHVLDSVVSFLLLESPSASWALDCLADRLSDCIHFLRSAVQSAWMPGFLVHNPHLLKRMPSLQLLCLLSIGHQENILVNVGPDTADTILAFLDARLQKTGLRRCLKEEYSTEMWEYEFFIFG